MCGVRCAVCGVGPRLASGRRVQEKPAQRGLITLDCVLRKGTQSNWRGKQARICVLCDASSSHTAWRESKVCTSPAPALL